MGFISVLNTTINIIYTFRRQATQEKNGGGGGGGTIWPCSSKKSQNSTLEISKGLMEGIKHWKYGQKSDPCLHFSASFTMRLKGIQKLFKIKAKWLEPLPQLLNAGVMVDAEQALISKW